MRGFSALGRGHGPYGLGRRSNTHHGTVRRHTHIKISVAPQRDRTWPLTPQSRRDVERTTENRSVQCISPDPSTGGALIGQVDELIYGVVSRLAENGGR